MTNRIHDLIHGEISVKMMEQDMKNEMVYQKKNTTKKNKLSQSNCAQIDIKTKS